MDLDTRIASRMVVVGYWEKFDNVPGRQPPADVYDHDAWISWLHHARL